MNPSSQLVSVRKMVVAQVTIPAVGSAATVSSLITAALNNAGEAESSVVGWRISDHKADRTTKRPAVCIGDTVATCVSAYAQDSEVFPPVCDTTIVVGGIAGPIVDAVFEIYLK